MSSAVTVRVPTILRTYTGGSSTVTADGATVGEVIDNLESAHPGIRARVVDETGALRRFVNIYLDDEDIRFGDGLDSQHAGDETGHQRIIVDAANGQYFQRKNSPCNRCSEHCSKTCGYTTGKQDPRILPVEF